MRTISLQLSLRLLNVQPSSSVCGAVRLSSPPQRHCKASDAQERSTDTLGARSAPSAASHRRSKERRTASCCIASHWLQLSPAAMPELAALALVRPTSVFTPGRLQVAPKPLWWWQQQSKCLGHAHKAATAQDLSTLHMPEAADGGA